MAIPTLLDSQDRLTDAIFFGSRLASGGGVPSTRTITTGFGLSGGGDLSTNRTIYVNDEVYGYNILNHGAVAGGVTDNTAVYTAIFALATRGVLVFPPGVFKGDILMPDTGDTREANWCVVGAGISETFLLPSGPDLPVISKANRSAGVIQGVTVGGFTIKADPGGSTGAAIDMAGFRSCEFQNIGYVSNAGGDYASLFHLSAAQMVCYANQIDHVVIDGGTVTNTGPATVVLFDRLNDVGVAPAFPGGMANECTLTDFFVYSNTGITTGIDALRSDGTTVMNCFWELNPGCTYVIPGNGTTLINNDYELGVPSDTILFTSVGGEGAGNQVVCIGDQFSDTTDITFHNCQDNLIINPENGTFITWANDGSGHNNLVQFGGRFIFGTLNTLHLGSHGTAPTVASSNLGTGGTVTLLTGSNDTDGIIELNFGTSVLSTNGIVTLTFAVPYVSVPCVIAVPAEGGPGYVWDSPTMQVGDIAVNEVFIRWKNATQPSDNSTLRINYHIKGIPS